MIRTFDYQKMPIVDVLNDILVDSVKRGASDIHFDPQFDNLLIRIRIDGILYDYAEVPMDVKDYLITRIKTISRLNITESRLPQDGAIKTTLQDVDMDLRVSSLPVSTGEKIVIRILDYSMSMAGLGELDFSESNYKKVLDMISVPNGIILVTGATGSGKSTTVYSILQHLNTSETNIITVEDPIEMDIKGINQVQTNSKIGLTFATALRSILRQDPNIIMIGEIRDTETARIAVRASITGHLVLSTLHTNTALNTIERLIDMDVQKYLLASALEGVIAQRLARRLCNHCKKKRATTNYEKDIFKTVLGIEVNEVYDAEGCEHCNNGFHGRIPVHEVLKISQGIRDALSDNASKDVIRNMVYSEADVTTMLQDGLEKVIAGHTSFEEIVKIIELDDENQLGGTDSLAESIDYTKSALAAQLRKKKETDVYVSDTNEVSGPENETLVNEMSETNNQGEAANDTVTSPDTIIQNEIPSIPLVNDSNIPAYENNDVTNQNEVSNIANNNPDVINQGEATNDTVTSPDTIIQNEIPSVPLVNDSNIPAYENNDVTNQNEVSNIANNNPDVINQGEATNDTVTSPDTIIQNEIPSVPLVNDSNIPAYENNDVTNQNEVSNIVNDNPDVINQGTIASVPAYENINAINQNVAADLSFNPLGTSPDVINQGENPTVPFTNNLGGNSQGEIPFNPLVNDPSLIQENVNNEN